MRCIDDLLNGNLSDAKRMAQHKPLHKIRTVLMRDYGYKEASATVTANYLKGRATFQDHCDQLDRDNNQAREALEARLTNNQERKEIQ